MSEQVPDSEPVVDRLKRLLDDLDTDFQREGLMEWETEARGLGRQLMDLDKAYCARYGEHLFAALVPKADIGPLEDLLSQMGRARNRLHDLEGDHSAIVRLLEAVTCLRDELREVKAAVEAGQYKAPDLRGKGKRGA